MPQFSVTQNAIPAQPGMAFDAELSSRDVVSAPAAVNIPFGVYCELNSSGQAVPLQTATVLSGTVTVTNGNASITFSTNQTLPAGQVLMFSDQPTMAYRLAAAVANSTSGTLDRLYSGTGGAGKTTSLGYAQNQGIGNSLPGGPQLLGISLFDPLGTEQNYTTWSVPTVLAGTVNVVNGSPTVTFTNSQTLAQGSQLTFASQPGVVYFMAQAISATTVGTLTANYSGTTNGATTATQPQGGSTASGWRAGQMVPFMRRGRIWVAGDASGSSTGIQMGALNVHHSSTGTNPQGVFTFLAPNYVAGNEIDVAPACSLFNFNAQFSSQYTDPFGNVFSIYPVEINLV